MQKKKKLQRNRIWFQAGFFILFVIAPPLDLLRFDLNLNHFFFLGMHWTLGLDAFLAGEISPLQAALNLIMRGFVPLIVVVGGVIWISWKYGRLYCGWLCPHFSVVETINRLMIKASGKPSIWERKPLPQLQSDGSSVIPDGRYWILIYLLALVFAFVWAVSLLTYLLPPIEIYHNLWHAELTPNQARFLGVATLLLFIEFMFARHLFCRFGCAVGLFQSLAWMGNDRAMVVAFDRDRSSLCGDCNNACDNVCPMRLKPRSIKRRMFTCTECALCISTCEQVQERTHEKSLLKWVFGKPAIAVTTSRPGNQTEGGN